MPSFEWNVLTVRRPFALSATRNLTTWVTHAMKQNGMQMLLTVGSVSKNSNNHLSQECQHSKHAAIRKNVWKLLLIAARSNLRVATSAEVSKAKLDISLVSSPSASKHLISKTQVKRLMKVTHRTTTALCAWWVGLDKSLVSDWAIVVTYSTTTALRERSKPNGHLRVWLSISWIAQLANQKFRAPIIPIWIISWTSSSCWRRTWKARL